MVSIGNILCHTNNAPDAELLLEHNADLKLWLKWRWPPTCSGATTRQDN